MRGPWDQASAGVEVGVLENLSFEWYNNEPRGGGGSLNEPKNAEYYYRNIRAKDSQLHFPRRSAWWSGTMRSTSLPTLVEI